KRTVPCRSQLVCRAERTWLMTSAMLGLGSCTNHAGSPFCSAELPGWTQTRIWARPEASWGHLLQFWNTLAWAGAEASRTERTGAMVPRDNATRAAIFMFLAPLEGNRLRGA